MNIPTTCGRCGGTRLAPSLIGSFRGTCYCRCGRPVHAKVVTQENRGKIEGFCTLLRGHKGLCNVDPQQVGAA